VTSMPRGAFARYGKEIACSFLQMGATAYGGLAITGIIQSELQEKRQWVSKAHFLEGVALIHLLPGAGLVHLSTFLGYARGGWWGVCWRDCVSRCPALASCSRCTGSVGPR
jgi:chromate transport protein ChrA